MSEALDYEAILAHLKTLSCEERFIDEQGNTWTCRDGVWNVLYAINRPKMPLWSLTPPGTELEPGWFESEERQHFIRDAYRLAALNDPVIPPKWEIPKPEDL